MEERIDLVVEEGRKGPGASGAVAVSVVFHALLIAFLIHSYQPVGSPGAKNVPIARYVQLIKQNPRDFVEAPGRAVEKAPLNAPFSDANRHASMPRPNGDTPTLRPGDGGAIYTPPAERSVPSPRVTPQQARPATQPSQQTAAAPSENPIPDELTSAGSSRIPAYRASAVGGAAADVNWHDALKDIKVASLGGGQDLDLGKLGGGGDKGYAEAGPLSFETQWYDWGAYAQSMVSRIRVNWYANMPQLIRTGMKGVVTIRFTIHRDGSISDITILNGSTIPPYDFAAKKAIELSTPLNPLPKDFPNPFERVTAMFFYNSDPPR